MKCYPTLSYLSGVRACIIPCQCLPLCPQVILISSRSHNWRGVMMNANQGLSHTKAPHTYCSPTRPSQDRKDDPWSLPPVIFSFPNLISEVFWKQCDTVRRTMKTRWRNSQELASWTHHIPKLYSHPHTKRAGWQSLLDTLWALFKAFWPRISFRKIGSF